MQDPRLKIQESTCTARVGGKVCGGTLHPGTAIPQAIQCSEEGTMSQANWAGVATIVEVLKCQSCGHSFIPAVIRPAEWEGRMHGAGTWEDIWPEYDGQMSYGADITYVEIRRKGSDALT